MNLPAFSVQRIRRPHNSQSFGESLGAGLCVGLRIYLDLEKRLLRMPPVAVKQSIECGALAARTVFVDQSAAAFVPVDHRLPGLFQTESNQFSRNSQRFGRFFECEPMHVD